MPSLISVEVSTHGLEFDEVVQHLSGPLRQKLVEKLADIAYASAFYGVPWLTGRLAQSIVKEIGDGEVRIAALAPYAMYVVNGTSPHEIRPVNTRVLAFSVKGKMVFASLVHHPGTKPNPFMQEAAENARWDSKVENHQLIVLSNQLKELIRNEKTG
ncbi:MAG: hypothetical protein M1167_05785 [Chloroflexi bacterium]|nr:hypothetical protein [Chloroflexota bacterium]